MGCRLYINEENRHQLKRNHICPIYLGMLLERVNAFSAVVSDAVDVFYDFLNGIESHGSMEQYLKTKPDCDADLIRGVVKSHDESWLRKFPDWKYALFFTAPPEAYHNVCKMVCD